MGKLKEFINKDRDQIKQFIRFCIVGTVAAGIHYGIYYMLLRFGVFLLWRWPSRVWLTCHAHISCFPP